MCHALARNQDMFDEMRYIILVVALALVAQASQTAFSVNDDVFAFPQYEISFSDSYIHEEAVYHTFENAEDETTYEQVILHGRNYFCSIPHVKPTNNETEDKPSEEEQKNELIRAADRGWQLLQDMEGKQCLYYSTGWWSYSYCYNSQVTQFHALQPGTSGARMWPPQEDPMSPTYVLGKVKKEGETGLQTKAESTYLVQRLEGGTPCDLTGEDRKVEIEFHCHPQSTDRIGWIKETATCSYLMVIYTPRLCNDVAFQPAKGAQAYTISCQQIVTNIETASIEPHTPTESEAEKRIMVGDIELGGRKYVGQDSKKLEKGRIVMSAEEKAEIVVMQKDGQIQSLNRQELKKMNLDPDDVEAFRKELAELAGSKDWKIEKIDEGNKVQLRGVVSTDEEEEAKDTGSEEKYKDEV